MSKHRVKNVGYDDDDYYDDDGYESPDPEEQEFLQQCTAAVLQQLRAGQPSVTATKEEVQDALWHYYNDVEKSVTYLRGKKEKETQKQQASAALQKQKAMNVPAYPAPNPPPIAHFSAADFFRDCPWLNVPPNRKADIMIEPLYPRLGLLGGAPEAAGKVSKLAALAAARKKKDGEKTPIVPETPSTPQSQLSEKHIVEPRGTPLSLSERLARSAKSPKPSETQGGLRRLGKSGLASPSPARTERSPEPTKEGLEQSPTSMIEAVEGPVEQPEPEQPAVYMRAPPSTFANTIVGEAAGSTTTEPSHLHSNSVDLLRIYGQDPAEPFDFAGPSPDDVVLNAQNTAKGFKSKPTASKPGGDKKAQADLAGGMKDLSVEEKVTVKSKNLDVLAEYNKSKRKKSANFVVIGHVDAGKSTLMGRLLADQGAIDQRTLDKYKREAEKIGKGSFALAWVLDQGTEERARGVTIDIATNKFETDTTAFTIVDAPGHRDFVPNMIAGASQADFAVLVIDSSVGKFESGLKGQTKEHALLVRSMGVQKIIVAVNKMDTTQWDKGRFEEIEQQISSFLTTAGFQGKNISFVPCSGVLGDNISRRSEDPHASWYAGRTLIQELETSEPYTHALDKPLRMTIGDVFRGGVQNPLSISGRLDAGSLQVGDQILTMPSAETALIRSVEVDGETSDWAVAGQNIVLNLANIDPVHLRSGDVVCRSSSPIPTITTFTAKVLAFEHLMPMLVDVHRGRLHVPGRISKLVASLDKASGAAIKKRPKIVGPGTVARVVVEMDQAVPLEAPTRIVLRTGGSTVAAGLLE
ncbi:Translation elongation/initiation factor/Ribosomal beta-barrel [Penicillium hispanicum]|uniref:Translation elongation/initiation factor/Ribosomal beta-barrel n=1 Tax=Penicillium hispanicum TaxID=1080232 RepID=UPI002542302B|nr:Translation elongation/initiation factor/Ribosomal beta-barrel [Penicillium hispanicum]KAJ5595173.1 Translation elongation/initiation factor/Ribosomal beta-barrel [Penicillium hispanicum]